MAKAEENSPPQPWGKFNTLKHGVNSKPCTKGQYAPSINGAKYSKSQFSYCVNANPHTWGVNTMNVLIYQIM